MKNNSVLILSIQDDQSTDELIMWLNKFELSQIFRLNDEDLLDELRLLFTGSNEEVIINGKNLLKFDSIFIRKGQLPQLKIKNKLEDIEFQVVKDYILHTLEKSKNCIGSVTEDLNHNKLLDFQVAKKVGLNIPDTWVVRRKQDFKYIPLNQNIEFLIKPLKNYYVVQEDGVEIVLDIFELTNFMESIPVNFFPSLVQKKIPKIFEIRTFFLIDKFYSIAIFSQKNKNTQLSFKNIDKNLINRMVPFQIPKFIERKLILFFKEKDMKTGSVDLIYSSNKIFYFLEVNPVGQFHWLSKLGNYQIEKDLAKRLIDL